jgi:lysophospholipase L1-like esterase
MLDMMKHFTRPLAVLAIAALSACGGGSGSTVQPPTNASPAPIPLTTTGVALVGVGDSLTAGYQSGGFLGDPTATSSFSLYPGGAVPPGQESGFWTYLYEELTGTSATAMYNAATSPLPLIKAPGLANQLVIGATGLAMSQGPTGGCNLFNLQGFSASGWTGTRLSTANMVTDLGVPGITMHEAIAMSGPLTGPPPGAPTSCSYPSNPADLTAGGLQALVTGESELFYPVLGGYQSNFRANSLTELNVAVALKPKLATVWLGANDLLKYIFSNGQSPISDTPTQMAADLKQIVSSLKATGAKVLVADLPNVLTTPQFFPVASGTNPAKLVQDFATLLVVATAKSATPIPPAAAGPYAAAIVPYLVTTYCGGTAANCYFTETGVLTALAQSLGAIAQNQAAPAFSSAINLDAAPCGSGGAGSGTGGCYITPAFAAQITALNTGYNQAIDSVATGSGTSVALVPITATFTALAAPGATLANILPGAPAVTLAFGGGLLGWDGLHPSNVGYAAIANVFIQTAVTSFGLPMVPLTGAQVSAIAINPTFPDPYNPTVVNAGIGLPVFPLP